MSNDKIDALFKYRMIPWLMDQAEIKRPRKTYRKLSKLQKEIYLLDAYLEENWKIKPEKLDKCWRRIHDELGQLGIPKTALNDWTQEILNYQEQELALRRALLPTRLNIKYFYYYKSCDVRLIRRLIYRSSQSLEHHIPISSWNDFDLLTEINDDILDVSEDLKVYNCNRFLFSVYACGKDRTRKEYYRVINRILKRSNRRLKKCRSVGLATIHHETKQVGEETKAQLRKVLDSKAIKKVVQAKTIRKWATST